MNTEDARNELLRLLRRGTTIYTMVHSISRSGLTRRISVYVVINGEIQDITYLVSRVTSFSIRRDARGLYVQGVGMDMGFHVVYTLSRVLFDDGYALNQRWL